MHVMQEMVSDSAHAGVPKIAEVAPESGSRRGLKGLVVAAAACSMVFGGASAASASAAHSIARTDGEGVWVHSVPALHDGLLSVLPEGTAVTVKCWSSGDTVEGLSVWDYVVAADGTEGYVADWFVDTHWSTTQDLTDQGIPECDAGGGSTSSDSAAAPEGPIAYEGDYITDTGAPLALSYGLYDHYMWGNGRAAVLDPNFFASSSAFVAKVKSMGIGQFGPWSAQMNSDLFLALGTFTISRETENCWAIYDHYDFTPDKVANLGYIVYWSYQLSGAREFEVHASGCF